MKKVLFAILGTVFLFAACTKNEIPQIEQNPYRMIIEYTPGTHTMDVPGTLTPLADYSSWLTLSQSGNTASFEVRRNTTGLIRRAEFSIAGGGTAVVNQEAHSLDAVLAAKITRMDLKAGEADVTFSWTSAYTDDYQTGWGYIISSSSDISAGKDYPQTSTLKTEGNDFYLTGLDSQKSYFIWTYIKSTENDVIYSNMVAVLPPIHVDPSATDLQKIIDGAAEYQTIMVPGGMTFNGPIEMGGKNKNKIISGGWNADFSAQTMDNLTVLDGRDFSKGFNCAQSDDGPLDGFVEISYFEIKNCTGNHGTAVHACGGPVTVHHCYVHDNHGEKGAIGTREEDFSTTITVYNCTISDNTFAGGHGAALHFGDGANYDDQVMATVVNNLIINNKATQFDGYCAVYICYNNTDLVFVNNTVVGNFNYYEDTKPETTHEYPGMNHRGNVRCLHANNIIVGNRTSLNVDPPELIPFQQFFNFDGGAGTFTYNVYEGTLKGADNASVSENHMFDAGFDIKTVLKDPDNLDYSPQGVAINGGTLATVTYKEKRDAGTKSVNIAELLEKYNTDLSGEPRVVGGKVSCGCFQN